jgi:Spy/CpxP family protein refolding chaperone
VTIADTAASRRSIRHPLLWVVISLSLAVNLFFVAGALWTRFHAPLPLTRAERFDEMATALALDPQQRQDFARYAQTMRGQLEAMRKAASPLVRATWTEVSKPQPNETKVMALLDEAMRVRRGHLNEITEATIAFLKNLSPEQRVKFVKLVHQGPPPWSLQFPRRHN